MYSYSVSWTGSSHDSFSASFFDLRIVVQNVQWPSGAPLRMTNIELIVCIGIQLVVAYPQYKQDDMVGGLWVGWCYFRLF